MAEQKQPTEVPSQPLPEEVIDNSTGQAAVEAELPLPTPPVAAPQSQPLRPVASGSLSPSERSQLNSWNRFRNWYTDHKKLSIPLSTLALLVLLLALPVTRYPLAGLVLKKNFTLQIIDQTTYTPVSGAGVSSGSVSTLTDGNGKAKLRLAVGRHNLKITKKYYQDRQADVLVPILKQKNTPNITAQATGRQVKISVKNSISKKSLANVDIKVLDITAKTDKDGNALLVLPAGVSSQKAKLTLTNYNDAEVEVKVSDSKIEENDFTITPAGKVYFLSKQSGKIDLVKSNLDGSQRETVLAGTSKEDNYNTVLLASRDWKYLALLSRRDSDLAKLYLIETANDKVTAIDEGNADFELIGWSDAHFIYQVNRKGHLLWQPKQHALKSYDAAAKKINLLDETDAAGASSSDAKHETYSSINIVNNRLVFAKSWFFNSDTDISDSNQLGIYSISVTSSGGRAVHKTFSYQADLITYEQSFPYRPDQIYFQVVEKSGEAKHFVYANNQVSENSAIKEEFNNYIDSGQYNTYLQSPSGKATFWSESRDGKNSLFIGDAVGDGVKQIATLSDYQAYGWYSDDYLLVSKNGSELYVIGKDEIKKDPEALKITDYHKPAASYHGGGYGGL